jgi:UDP-GlcNAc:undecaprenyl-phosphate GlcNAc-1-phosphate transferase
VIARPGSLAVPLIMLALPVLDTSFVTAARIRNGRPVGVGGTDHLSHRLVALGLSPHAAVATLIGVQASLSAIAVLVGRAVISPPIGLVAAALLLLTLTLLAATTRIYELEPYVGRGGTPALAPVVVQRPSDS